MIDKEREFLKQLKLSQLFSNRVEEDYFEIHLCGVGSFITDGRLHTPHHSSLMISGACMMGRDCYKSKLINPEHIESLKRAYERRPLQSTVTVGISALTPLYWEFCR